MGLSLLKKFWVCLFDSTDQKQYKPAFLFLGLEITPGVAIPEVKIYIPAWTCGFQDAEIANRLEKYFKSQNLVHGSSYVVEFRDFDELKSTPCAE